jgi:hypothetical protein
MSQCCSQNRYCTWTQIMKEFENLQPERKWTSMYVTWLGHRSWRLGHSGRKMVGLMRQRVYGGWQAHTKMAHGKSGLNYQRLILTNLLPLDLWTGFSIPMWMRCKFLAVYCRLAISCVLLGFLLVSHGTSCCYWIWVSACFWFTTLSPEESS